MAKRTVRKSDNGIELHANKNELLEYRLTVSGAGANFAWADDKQKILTQLDFGAADEIVWQLKSELTPDNKIKLTVPKNPNYQRVENAGARFSLVLTLGFVTAIGYTLTVRR